MTVVLLVCLCLFPQYQATCHQLVEVGAENSSMIREAEEPATHQLSNMVQQFRHLESELGTQQKTIQELTELVNRQQELVQKQERKIQHLEAEVKEQKMLNTKQQQEIEEAKQQQVKQEDAIQGMKAAMTGQQDVIKSQTEAQQDNTVAFSAYHNVSGTAYYEEGERIIFPGTKFNSGSYDTTDSVFTCPVNGIYFFMTNIEFVFDDLAYGETVILRGAAVLGKTYAVSFINNDIIYQTSTTSVVTGCTAGELVFVQASYQSQIFGRSILDDYTTTFVGFLLALE